MSCMAPVQFLTADEERSGHHKYLLSWTKIFFWLVEDPWVHRVTASLFRSHEKTKGGLA